MTLVKSLYSTVLLSIYSRLECSQMNVPLGWMLLLAEVYLLVPDTLFLRTRRSLCVYLEALAEVSRDHKEETRLCQLWGEGGVPGSTCRSLLGPLGRSTPLPALRGGGGVPGSTCRSLLGPQGRSLPVPVLRVVGYLEALAEVSWAHKEEARLCQL
jgi:hypothetical protein